MAKYYKVKNILKVGSNYALTAGVVAGSFLLGGPVAMGVAAAFAVGITVASTRSQKKFFENNLVRYPDVHPDSPHLGEIAQELYKKSGLKSPDGYPIYSFLSKPKIGKKTSILQASLDRMAKTQNAASVRLGKPVIMISEPLLKLLDEKEEKAALAHEFAHAAARHNAVSLPQRVMIVTSAFSNLLTQVNAMVTAGWIGVGSSFAAQIVTEGLFKIVASKGKFLFAKDKDLTLAQLARKKKVASAAKFVGTVAGVAALTYFSPAYLGIFAAVTGMSIASTLLSKSLTRSSEYQADAGAVTLGADPLALITALRKITLVQERSVKAAFGGELPKSGKLTKIWKTLNADHPNTDRRVKRLSSIARKQGIGEEAIRHAANDTIVVPPENDLPYSVIESLMR